MKLFLLNKQRFLLSITILIVLFSTVFAATSSRAATICSPATAISGAFTKDGAGDFCWSTTSLCSYINSWNLSTLEVNGTAYTNAYSAASAIAPVNGLYTIHYNSTVAWGHFEIGGTCGGVSPTNTPVAVASATRTNTPVVAAATATRTNTPVVVAATATRTPTSVPVTGNSISPYLVGNNVWYNPSDTTWNVSAQAGLKIIRIGGIEYDNNFPSNATLTTWVGKIKGMGAEPMLQVSRYASAQTVAAVVTYFNVTTNNKIKYWNIGNEPSCGTDTTAIAASIASYTKNLAAAMKAVDPSILIFGPDSCDYGDVVYGALFKGDNSTNDISGKVPGKTYYYVDGVSWHRYVGYGPQYVQISGLTTAGAQDILDRVVKTRALIDNANTKQGRTGTAALQWGIGEFNGSDGGRACSFENGQFFGEIYGYLMKYKGTYGTTWSMQEGGGACGTTDFGFLDGNNKPRSSFYHMQMISQNFSGTYLDGTSNLTSMRTYGAIDTNANKIAVMLMNIDTAATRTCAVRLNSDAVGGTCSVNIPAGVAVTYNKTIAPQTTVVLIFNLQGQLTKTITYSIGNKNAGTAPSVTMP